MIVEQITEALATKIYNMGFISRCGSIAQEVRRENGSIPSATIAPFSGENKPVSMVPDHKETGVCWFEVSASRVIRQTSRVMSLQNEWRLVTWINGTRFSMDDILAAELTAMQAVRGARFAANGDGPLRGVTIQYQGADMAGPGVFARWAFDEQENLLTLPPYRAAAHRFLITYIVATSCLPQLAVTAPAC